MNVVTETVTLKFFSWIIGESAIAQVKFSESLHSLEINGDLHDIRMHSLYLV
jgi:hypothetical protein